MHLPGRKCVVSEKIIVPFSPCHVYPHSPMSKNKKPKKWWGDLFLDHPGLDNKDTNAYVESGTGITKSKKVYCEACMSIHMKELKEEDQHSVDQGRITIVRDDAEIRTYCGLNIGQFI
jgi:hypothetical protein